MRNGKRGFKVHKEELGLGRWLHKPEDQSSD